MQLAKLTKTELIWMAKHSCKHGHKYIEHPSCYQRDVKPKEKIGFFDIECSNLKANFGIILSYAVKRLDGRVQSSVITPNELKSPTQDKRIVQECITHMCELDRVIGYYSLRFDLPFVRSRAMAHNIPFPGYGELKQTDLYFWVRNKMLLHSNRLQVACDFLGIPAKEHKLDGLIWTKALAGNTHALEHVHVHNREDVCSTEEVFKRLLPFHRLTNTWM